MLRSISFSRFVIIYICNLNRLAYGRCSIKMGQMSFIEIIMVWHNFRSEYNQWYRVISLIFIGSDVHHTSCLGLKKLGTLHLNHVGPQPKLHLQYTLHYALVDRWVVVDLNKDSSLFVSHVYKSNAPLSWGPLLYGLSIWVSAMISFQQVKNYK